MAIPANQRVVIPSIPARPPRISLIGTAPTLDTGGARWENGFRMRPEKDYPQHMDPTGASPSHVAGGIEPADDCVIGARPFNANRDTAPAIIDAEPMLIWQIDVCSTLGWAAADYAGRALRALEAQRSYRLAQEVWEGRVSHDRGLPNVALTDGNGYTAAPIESHKALNLVEQALGDVHGGAQGMIHMSPQVFGALVTNGGVRWSDSQQRYLSPMENLIVADAGYRGASPLGSAAAGALPAASQWIYGTSMLYLVHDEPQLVPAADENAMRLSIDRATNTVTQYAQQVWGYMFANDGNGDSIIGAEVDIALPPIY